MFYSPFSIHVIMFMASFGANSKTFDEMVATIHVNKINYSLEAYQKLLENLTNKTDDVLKLATGMFVDTAFKIKQLFIDNSLKYLNFHMEKLNFLADPESQRQYLNNWVLKNTNHKIKDLFPEGLINESTALVMVNAIHFQGKWNKKFSFTQNEPFYLNSDNKVTVQMMNLKHNLNYYHDDELKYSVLELPYELGCPTMFIPSANFSNISDDGKLYVSSVLHKAYVDVDEKGTEATAATGIMLVNQCAVFRVGPSYEIKFFGDHPFIFYVASRNKDILFFGRVKNLTEEKQKPPS